MNRRSLLQLPFALVCTTTLRAADQPWSARLLQGGFDGKNYWSGIAISLAPKWKTYWRVPGDGGIAPQFDITGLNLKSHLLEYPAPALYIDAAGLTIGYKNEVVFPLAVEAENLSQPVQLQVKAFIGVCDEVCIPAQFELSQTFSSTQSNLDDQRSINEWRKRVPIADANGPVVKAIAKQKSTGIQLQLELTEALDYVFVEGDPKHYFGQPAMMRGLAVFDVRGAKSLDDLRTVPLRLTIKKKYDGARALEQIVKVD